MVDSMEDFMAAFKGMEKPQEIEDKICEILSISMDDMKSALSKWVQENSDELASDFGCIAPHNDWGKMIDETSAISDWFKSDGHKPEHWKLEGFSSSDIPNLIGFGFINVAVDEGDACSGIVYVSLQGKIKHAFAKAD